MGLDNEADEGQSIARSHVDKLELAQQHMVPLHPPHGRRNQ